MRPAHFISNSWGQGLDIGMYFEDFESDTNEPKTTHYVRKSGSNGYRVKKNDFYMSVTVIKYLFVLSGL